MGMTAQFNMRLDTELKRKLDEAALLDRRTTSQLITVILDHWLMGRHYPTSFDPSTIGGETLAERLRPPPGRPRTVSRLPSDWVQTVTAEQRAWIAERDEVTIDDLIAGPFAKAAANPNVSHALPKLLRELLDHMGLIERSKHTGERVWIKLSD